MMDPPGWVLKATGTIPAATAAAEPLDDPPGVWSRLRGFRVGPGWRKAYSAVTVLPSGIAPARTSDSTQDALKAATLSSLAGEPQRVGMPAAAMTSFTPNGMPASGPLSVSGSGSSALPARWAHARTSGSFRWIWVKEDSRAPTSWLRNVSIEVVHPSDS